MFVIHPPHFLPPKNHRARKLALAFLCIAPFLIGLLALHLGQDANWDLRNYHWYNAWAFINDRYGKDLMPSQTPYFYNPLMDVPFFELATHVSARWAGFILGCVQGLNIILIFMIAHATLIIPNPRHKVIICAALAMLGMLGGGGVAQIGTTFGDNISSLGILLSAALVVRHMERILIGNKWRAFGLTLLFGIPAGFAMGLKLPCVIYSVGFCGGLLFTSGHWRRGVLLAFGFGCGVLVGCAITYAHWGAFLYHNFGSPVFPYFNQVFKSPMAPAVSSRDIEYAPYGWDWLLMPYYLTRYPFRVGEIEWHDWRILILYVLLPLAILLRLFFGRNRKQVDAVAIPYPARYLLASFAISYFVWLDMFTIYRYAVTLEMIAPLLIVYAVGMLPLKVSARGLITAFLLAVISASIVPGNWHRRATWMDGHFIEAGIPPLGDTSNLMILMAGIEPYSHLLPEFPAEISWVRIQSNFTAPEQDKGINRLIRDRVEAHKAANGRFAMLIPDWQHQLADQNLAYFGLKLAATSCQKVTDRLFDDKQIDLCDVTAK